MVDIEEVQVNKIWRKIDDLSILENLSDTQMPSLVSVQILPANVSEKYYPSYFDYIYHNSMQSGFKMGKMWFVVSFTGIIILS